MSERVFAAYIYVTQTEHDAVVRMYDWEVKAFDGDDQKYMEACMQKDGHTVKVVAAQQREMGMTAAATLSMKLIERYDLAGAAFWRLGLERSAVWEIINKHL